MVFTALAEYFSYIQEKMATISSATMRALPNLAVRRNSVFLGKRAKVAYI